MKKISKVSIALVSLLMLNGCSQVGSEILQDDVISQETIGTSNITEMTVTETIGTSEENILDITSYIKTLSNEEINNKVYTYLYDMEFYTYALGYIENEPSQEDIEYAQFRMQCINKKYPLDLSTNYPMIDEYYRLIDSWTKQKLDTLSYVDGKATFTYKSNLSHDEIEQQFQDIMDSYYYDVTNEKVQELNYPFNKVIVNNNVSSDLIDIEKKCVEKYKYHYNGLRCLRYSTFFNIWGEDAPSDKDWAIKNCYQILCRMKNFTEEYSTVVGENPEDVDLVNEYIEKYSSAYMYVLENRDTLTNEEIYTYLHNFLFDEGNMDLQTKIYQLEIPNLDEILIPID